MYTQKHSYSRQEKALTILDAADQLIGEVGYDGVSARDIAERAGVNKALVFYYWGSKAELFDRVLERYYEAHRATLENAFRTAGPLATRVHRMVDAYLDFIELNRSYPRLVQQQLAGGGTHRETIQRHLAPFFDWTTEMISEIAPAEGARAARHLYVTLAGIVTNYFTYTPALAERWEGDPLSPSALAERRAHVHWVVDTLLKALQTEHAKGAES